MKICQKCLMDETDPKIEFDAQGVCNHCHQYQSQFADWRPSGVEKVFAQIKATKTGEWDSIMGLSGGVDSSYVASLAMQYGLNPLCVHLDNGWNSELAVSNIHKIVKAGHFELYTHVINWEEFKDLQRSFFQADVIDLELLTDHAIFTVILQLAKKHRIKYILSGANFATEAVMPSSWVHPKQDKKNIKAIHKKYGTRPLKTFPMMSTLGQVLNQFVLGYQIAKPLNFIEYNKNRVKEELKKKFDWRDYGGKHYESLFTKFYQAHILPTKFNVDKRKAHLSTLINSGQLSREEAMAELSKPLYDLKELETDMTYVCKKLGFTLTEMQEYLQRPPRSHYDFPTEWREYIFWGKKLLGR